MNKDNLRKELERPLALDGFNEQVYGAMTDLDRTEHFHRVMGLTANETPIMPSVSQRILRAKLLLEEVFETIERGLGLTLSLDVVGTGIVHIKGGHIGVVHLEGSFYDPIETLDGLADVKVITEGTAVAFGLPLEQAAYEVYCSNMSKLDDEGKPIVNECKYFGGDKVPVVGTMIPPFDTAAIPDDMVQCDHRARLNDCSLESHMIDPSKPKGKLLKPESYVPANITRILIEYSGKPADEMRQWLANIAHD